MSTDNRTKSSSPLAAWVLAARPRTLALAFAGIGMGTFLAAAAGVLNGAVAVLCFVTATLLQILSNLANDYGDSIHGADSPGRVGPPRAVQTGQITPAAMKRAVILFAILAMLSGLALVWLAFVVNPVTATDGWWLLIIFLGLGGLAVAAAVTYTAGFRPYGYAGLGDLAVFIFFGWVAVAGSYYLHAHALPWTIFMPATSCGLFAVGVLNVNNIRDIKSDRAAGKQSLPVRLGLRRARLYHWALLLGGLISATLYIILTYHTPWQWLFLLAVPLFLNNGFTVWRQEGAALDPMLRQLSLSSLLFVILFGVGQLL